MLKAHYASGCLSHFLLDAELCLQFHHLNINQPVDGERPTQADCMQACQRRNLQLVVPNSDLEYQCLTFLLTHAVPYWAAINDTEQALVDMYTGAQLQKYSTGVKHLALGHQGRHGTFSWYANVNNASNCVYIHDMEYVATHCTYRGEHNMVCVCERGKSPNW